MIKQLPETWGHVDTRHSQGQWKGPFQTKGQSNMCTNAVLDDRQMIDKHKMCFLCSPLDTRREHPTGPFISELNKSLICAHIFV